VLFLVYVVFLAIKAVNSSVMSSFIRAQCWLPDMQDQILFKLRWHSVSWWGNVFVMRCLKWKPCHNIVYEILPHCDTQITQDPTPKIIDTPLTLNLRMGQRACWYYFHLGSQRRPQLCEAATNHHLAYTRCTAKYRWRSIDAHFQNGAGTMSYTLLPRKAASTLVMYSSHPVTFQLPYLQD